MSDTRSSRQCQAQSVVQGAGSVALALVVTALTAPCQAQPDQPLELKWNAPPNCPQQAEVHEQVRRIVGATVGAEHMVRMGASGVVELVNDRFQLTLTIQEGDTKGTRVIASEDCANLGKAAAVVLGLLIRQERKLGRALSDSEIKSVSGALPTTAEAGPAAATPDGQQRDGLEPADSTTDHSQNPTAPHHLPLHLLLQVPAFNLDVGTLPSASVGIGLGVGVVMRPWHGVLTAELSLPQTKSSSSLPRYEAAFRRSSVAALACRGSRWAQFELAPCLQVALNIVSANASGDRLTSQSQVGAWASIGGGLTSYWHLSSMASLFLTAMGRIATGHPQFVVEGNSVTDKTHQVPAATLAISVGSAWIF